MRIALVAAYAPSPLRRRLYEFERGLVRRGHEVLLACPPAGAAGGRWAAALRRAPRLAAALVAGRPFQAAFDWDPRWSAALTARLAAWAPDVVHVEHLRAARYGAALAGRQPLLWDSVDCISDLFEQTLAQSASPRARAMARVELPRTRAYEARFVRLVDHCVVTSPRDREQLLRLAGGTPADASAPPSISVVPNGVDLAEFAGDGSPRDAATLLFSGKLSYHANDTAARYLLAAVMPVVWRQRPDARVVLAGAEPGRALRELAARAPGPVEVTGTVAELAPYLRRASLAVAPLVYGVGIQNKVLEAMAAATPVVASPVALRALAAAPGRDLLVGDDAAALAQHLLALLADPERAAAIGAAGRAYVERAHRWDDAVARLEEGYAVAVERFAARR